MKLKYLFKLILFLYFFILISTKSYSETLDKITITGNLRITDETIYTFLPVKINDDIDQNQIDIITKDLFETNFFEDIIVSFADNELNIKVVENPIIQNIIINGIKSETLKNFLFTGTFLKDRSSFIDFLLQEDISLIKTNLNRRGYYFSTIQTKIENLDENIINLIYDIDLGKKAKIKKISFIGDKVFKDKKLKSLILSEEYKFWKFISGKKFLNEELVKFDQRLILNFFKNKGFYNAKVSTSFAKLVDGNDFELIFNINAGKKFYFGKLNLDLPINYDKRNFSNLYKTLNQLENEHYSINSIEKITEQIDLLALYEQYESIDVDVVEEITENILNINFVIKETEKRLIRRVNILGNNVTRENVIRNQFEIDEGDIYNEILLNKTVNNLKSLNFFKSVESKIISEDITGDKTIEISVEEKPTGEIGASAGVGTSGNSIGVFIRENNYLGKGLGLETNLTLVILLLVFFQ